MCHYVINERISIVYKQELRCFSCIIAYFSWQKIEDYNKQGIVSNIEVESITTSIEMNLFYQHIMYFLNKPELSDQKIKLMEI